MQVAAVAAVIFNFQNRRESRKVEKSAGRAHYLSTLTMGRDEECTSQLRLNKASFDYLYELLRVRGLLRDSREVAVEEKVATCLHILAHAVKNRMIVSRFMRSGETVSRHFHGVLNAILILSPNFIRQSGQHTPKGPTHFKECVGAIDRTHILAFLPIQSQPSYRNRKGTLSQNVLAACGFDLKFQYVLPGWEGSATDVRILHNALSRSDPLVMPPGNHVIYTGFSMTEWVEKPYYWNVTSNYPLVWNRPLLSSGCWLCKCTRVPSAISWSPLSFEGSPWADTRECKRVIQQTTFTS